MIFLKLDHDHAHLHISVDHKINLQRVRRESTISGHMHGKLPSAFHSIFKVLKLFYKKDFTWEDMPGPAAKNL